jgi:hypothetical protein
MADPRTFTLIGEFKDGITPELEKINKQLATLKTNFAGVGSRKNTGFRGATREIGKLVSAHKNLADSVKQVKTELQSTVSVLRQYRSEMGKAAAANRAFQKSGGNLGSSAFAKNMRAANQEAQAYLRTLKQISAQGGRAPRMAGMPRGGGGGGRGGRSGGGRGGGGEAFGTGSNFHMGAFAFGSTIGQGLSQPIETAIFAGFNMGVNLLQKSFSYIAGAFAERVKDEMGDLSAAGGYYSIAKRQKDPFVKTLQQAVDFTQETNSVLARLASSLPGDTQDYVEVSKRVGDSIARLVTANEKGAMAYAQKLRQGQEDIYKAPVDAKSTMQILIGEITKKTVMAGFGGSAGAGGQRGPHGLPALMERMLTDQNISEAKLNKYAAIFGDPKISSAIGRYMPKLNAAGGDMLKRFQILNEMYDEIVPPEMIAAMRNSMAGMMEAFRSAFMNPEIGFLGIGRKLKAFAPKLNLYGQYINEAGEVVETAAEAAKADIGIYEMFRDIIANFGAALMPIIDNLTLLWDPMKEIGESLKGAREYSVKFLKWFRNYNAGIQKYAETLGEADKEKVLSTRNLRASMATINNMFRSMGVFGDAKFLEFAKQIKDPNVDLGKVMSGLAETFFSSDAAKKLGEFVGTLLGTVLKQIATATGFFSKRLKGDKLGAGFSAAFEKAGGIKALKDIFKDIYILLFEALKLAVQAIPPQAFVLAGTALLLQAAIRAVTMEFGQKLASWIHSLGGTMMGDKNLKRGGGGGGMFGPTTAMQSWRRKQRAGMRRKAANMRVDMLDEAAYNLSGSRAGRGLLGAGRAGRARLGAVGRLAKGVGKFVPGGAVAAGAINTATSLAMGEGIGKSVTTGLTTIIGGALGSAFGPMGTIAGSTIGSYAGGMLYDSLAGIFDPSVAAQNQAAEIQKMAAANQLKASQIRDVTGTNIPFAFDSQKLQAVLRLINIGKPIPGEQQALVALLKQKNIDLTAFNNATKILENQKERLALSFTPGSEQFKKALKPYQDVVNNAATKLKTSQSAFDAAFAKLPAATTQAIVTKIGNMTTGQIEAAIARKIQQIEVTANTNARNQAILDAGGRPGIIPRSKAELDKQAAVDKSFGRYGFYKGGLGSAISSELKHKPSGSHLLIANSSETVIPAAGGNGVGELINVFRNGFAVMVDTYKTAQQTLLTTIKTNHTSEIANLNKLNTTINQKLTTPSIGGLGGGAVGGGVDAFTGMASKYGLQLTSGYRPGDPGWHGSNRARDFSNGTGPTPQMMQFAQFLASNYGSNLKELIYTPLGFSIKNGQKVAPYAQGSHYNHVHVAYATGYGMPFQTAQAAMQYERAMTPGSLKVASITANSGENFGGGSTFNNTITIQQQPGQDPEQLAAIVVAKMGEWVSDARSSSIFV